MNILQKQALLVYLDCYEKKQSNKHNNIDGIWGPASKAALTKFQTLAGIGVDGIWGPESEKAILEVVGSGTDLASAADVNWDTVKYFKKSEFDCKCGGKYCDGAPAVMKQKLLTVADRVREHFGTAVIVSSGLRCSTHNTNVGGVANSRHLDGRAMDFMVKGKTAKEVLTYVQEQPEIRYAYAIDSNYLHMDIS